MRRRSRCRASLSILATALAFILPACTRSISPANILPRVTASATIPPLAQPPQSASLPTGFPTTTTLAPATVPPALHAPLVSSTPVPPTEVPVTLIPLAGPASEPKAEISGLAWYSDTLVLLPQYPSRFGDALFALPKDEIASFLDGSKSAPLEPRLVPFTAPGVDRLPGFEGFEAITFHENQVYLTAETRPGTNMLGYLLQGVVAPGLAQIRIDSAKRAPIPAQAPLGNMADEAIVVAGSRVVTFYEANGANVNPNPVAHLFTLNLVSQGTIPFPTIEYRITDATAMDASGRFWAINYFYPGDTFLNPAPDSLLSPTGEPRRDPNDQSVERLVQLQFGENGIQLSGVPPIQLQPSADGQARDWEGIAILEGRGFLLATDEHPGTLLGFVPATVK